jgi:acetyltransferase-like isoleucine patch superfamily enzyme
VEPSLPESKSDLCQLPKEPIHTAVINRVLQSLARSLPGAFTWRVRAHRMRGVKLGNNVHIASDVTIETAYPQWVSIGDNVQLGVRCLILAHIHSLPPKRGDFRDFVSVCIEDEVYVGPAAVILPNVRIGRGAVIAAGSVVTHSVPPMTMVQGNPAKAVARCGIPLTWNTPIKQFYANLKPIVSHAETIPLTPGQNRAGSSRPKERGSTRV